jgi:GWxTD domain-containing protein
MVAIVHISQMLMLVLALWGNQVQTPSPAELKARVVYADQLFAEGSKPGSQTDRGRVYIGLGPPDDIKDLRYTTYNGTMPPWPGHSETWTYRDVPGIGNDIKIQFNELNTIDEHEKFQFTGIYEIVPMIAPWSPDFNNDAASVKRRQLFKQLMQQIEETLKRVPKG